jgi:hypothetical protein
VSQVRTEAISLTEAAARMRVSYQVALDRVLRGEIEGWKSDRGNWLVSLSSVSTLIGRSSAARSGA